MRLADVADSRDNNFDVLRLFAASIVLVSHSFFLAGPDDPFGAWTGITLGSLGVALFFGMSGFLILKSWSFEPRSRSFFRKRALRIMPALWAALLLTTFVLGPIITTEPITVYFTSFGTWKYVIAGCLLVTFGGVLPGVFENNPYENAVNGSLWTLPIEASAYCMVAVLGVIGALRRPAVLPILFGSSLVVSFLAQDHEVLQNLRLYAFFLAGMLLYAQRARVMLSWPIAGVGMVAWVASFNTPALVVVSAIALPYVVMVVAYRTPAALRSITRFGDVSYGLYIYAFPVQQLVALALGDAVAPGKILVIAFPIAWLLGLASWRLVERPALRLKPSTTRPVADPPADLGRVAPAASGAPTIG